ncbi:putative ribosomal RNA small subunit methyltransferase, chloroplastic [Cocos nucifera]|uniref:rRNA adenine N(6)-methyltransferase n=1 Tax=Cocos nucifera TaxID=13894 RepID=A0A8K0IJ62_COCNU|nr:putative ribosomal RNA small subunit methyltransferase, chloroplastic [Cocos nucifera]
MTRSPPPISHSILSLAPPSPLLHPCARPRLSDPARPPLPVVAAAAASRRKRSEDDYHATIKSLNSKGRYTPRKSLGQHYMLNSSINEELSNVAEVEDGDVVLEIGPGTGSLTNVLIDAGATVIAIEKDPHMAKLVRDRFGCTDQLVVLQEDFTKCHIRSHLSSLLENKNSIGVKPRYGKMLWKNVFTLLYVLCINILMEC